MARTFSARRAVYNVGRYSPKALVHVGDSVLNHINLGQWSRRRGLRPAKIVPDRFRLFDMAIARLASSRQPLYLEFGVFKGESLNYIARHLPQEAASLHGFDSFEGLPEQWRTVGPKGMFDVGGEMPAVDDVRVTLHKGWFEDTLPEFQPPRHDGLFVNFDADIYSATVTAFKAIGPLITPGTLLYFDEFSDRQHELRAFDEFLGQRPQQVRALGATRSMAGWLFEYLG